MLHALIILAFQAPAETKDDAERRYRDLEARILAAKSVTIQSTLETLHGETVVSTGTGRIAGSLELNVGGLRFDRDFGKPTCESCKLQGSGLRIDVQLAPANTRTTRERMIANFLSGMDPLVTGAAIHIGRRDVSPDSAPGKLSGFRVGSDETVNGRAARVVDYTLAEPDATRRYSARLWIDSKTGLPIQRTAALEGTTVVMREVFTTFDLKEERAWVPTPGKRK